MKRIVSVGLLAFVALASNQHAKAEPQKNKSKFDVTILEPGRDNVVVEREVDVKGIARIPSGNHLWVLVHRIKGFEKVWWPQNEVEIDPQTGRWASRVFLGSPRPRDTGYDFAIAAITVNEQEHLKLQQYSNDAIAKSDWQPIKMPPTTAPPIYRKVKRDGNVVDGRAISLPKPAYPLTARASGASGMVVVEVMIDKEGNVIAAQAISGHPLLYEAAEAAAHQAKFSPTRLDGQPIETIGRVTFTFGAR